MPVYSGNTGTDDTVSKSPVSLRTKSLLTWKGRLSNAKQAGKALRRKRRRSLDFLWNLLRKSEFICSAGQDWETAVHNLHFFVLMNGLPKPLLSRAIGIFATELLGNLGKLPRTEANTAEYQPMHCKVSSFATQR